MFKLPIRTWVCNAAAVFSGPHGAVTEQAAAAQCSRETVYEHARKVEERLAVPPAHDAVLAELRAENQRLGQALAEREADAARRVRFDKSRQRQFATTAFAMGLSLRQIEDLVGLLLSESDAKAPDHTTLGRWVAEQARHAAPLLKVLDAQCASRVNTLCLDEIFLGGGRPWSGSNPQA
jgi:hypothetical protein